MEQSRSLEVRVLKVLDPSDKKLIIKEAEEEQKFGPNFGSRSCKQQEVQIDGWKRFLPRLR